MFPLVNERKQSAVFKSFQAMSSDMYSATYSSYHPFHQVPTYEQLQYSAENTRNHFSSPFSIRSILSRSSNSQLSANEETKLDCTVANAATEQNNNENFTTKFPYGSVFYTGNTCENSPEMPESAPQFYSSVGNLRWPLRKAEKRADVGDRRLGKKGTKRTRTIFTPTQLQRLEKEFETQQYVAGEERKQLATVLRLSETQVKVWFQNRRIRYRKQNQQAHKSSDTCLLKTTEPFQPKINI